MDAIELNARSAGCPTVHCPFAVPLFCGMTKFTLLTRGSSSYLTDRYIERKEAAAKLAERLRLDEAI